MKTLTLRIYKDAKKEFRWTLISGNGRKLANCGEGYKRRAGLENDIFLTFMGGFPRGESPVYTILAFRDDFRLEDLTEANAKTRCKGRKCK